MHRKLLTTTAPTRPPSRSSRALGRALHDWPAWTQVAGSIVACVALGALLGAAYGWLTGGVLTAVYGWLNERAT